VNLLSGPAESLMNSLLKPDLNIMQCDVRVMEDESEFIPGTKCILLLGEAAMYKYDKSTTENTLNEMRGSPLTVRGIPAYASFFPQDACDIINHEANLNEQSKEYTGDEEGEDEDEEGDVKSLSPTKRSNYAFWLGADLSKCKSILSKTVASRNGQCDALSATYKIYPSAQEVVSVLTTTKGHFFYFDIETDYEEQNLLCFSFAFWPRGASEQSSITVYSVPVLNNDYRWSYSSLHFILRGLAVAVRDNCVVAHNGASFDFFVLGYKYGIPVRECYDTMLAMHRCFPDIEKSLGHCTSYWTNERFHKDSDSHAYASRDHMMEKLRYCGKDVYTMFLVHQAIQRYARTIPGLENSIAAAMASIRPYLICTLQGIKYNPQKVDKIKEENLRLMMQYIRMLKLLIGERAELECKAQLKGKAKSFAGSNKQQCHYFHQMLGYQVMYKSPKTKLPSLGKKIMYRLALKYPNNPVITLILAYRDVAKQYGSLKFIPWKTDENKVYHEPRTGSVVTGSQPKMLFRGSNAFDFTQA